MAENPTDEYNNSKNEKDSNPIEYKDYSYILGNVPKDLDIFGGATKTGEDYSEDLENDEGYIKSINKDEGPTTYPEYYAGMAKEDSEFDEDANKNGIYEFLMQDVKPQKTLKEALGEVASTLWFRILSLIAIICIISSIVLNIFSAVLMILAGK